MRTLFADFNSIDDDPELGRFIPLGAASEHEDLRDLRDGEGVLLREPDEVQAAGYVVSRTVRGEQWWLGVITGAIEVIYQEPSRAASGEH